VKCDDKTGVDPDVSGFMDIHDMGSDDYFHIYGDNATFELIFIDGFHHADQVKRDFENSLRCLSDNGFIVIHDVLPENEEGTIVPRQTRQWWGDVYKWAMNIGQYANIGYKTFNIDNGCMMVWKSDGASNDSSKDLSINYDWNLYTTLGRSLMNVTNEVTI
jgi:predicted O-methyltransferase YrrM